MRYMKMNLGVWAFSALALLASCSDKDIVANVTIPDELEQAQTNGAGLESHSYGISFEVTRIGKSNSMRRAMKLPMCIPLAVMAMPPLSSMYWTT